MKKHYTAKQKAQIVLEILKEERSIAQISSEYGVHPNQLYRWKAQLVDHLEDFYQDGQRDEKALKVEHERQMGELYAEIGKLTTQLSWLKKKSGLEPPTE